MNTPAHALPRVLPAVPPGSTIALIAPAGPVAPDKLQAIPAVYAGFGYTARIYPGCLAQTAQPTGPQTAPQTGTQTGTRTLPKAGLPPAPQAAYLAGDDATRLADLHAALADDSVAAIHCLRGGYGCMRLLDGIDVALLRAHPKLLIGYSDITALHGLWCRAGVPTLHAPMPASDMLLPGREADRDALFAVLRHGLRPGQVLAPGAELFDPQGLRLPGHAEGRLIGGNLSLVAAVLGTPWAWPLQDSILFLEHISEQPYRVDRLLTQLRLAGVLAAARGFVLGSFRQAASPAALLRQMLAPLGKPILGGWPSGHGTPNRPLRLGVQVALDVPADGAPGTLTLL